MQVLDCLDTAWRAEDHATRKACLRARLAAAQARWGDEAASREAVVELRQAFLGREFSELSAALCLVEGLSFERQGAQAQAQDRFQRAHVLAPAGSSDDVRWLAGAWLAQQHAQCGRWGLCASTLREVLQAASPHQHEVLARTALTLANVFLLAGWGALASIWFARARDQAARDADGVTLGHLLHDMATGQVSRLRRIWTGDRSAVGAPDLVRGQSLLDTARNYLTWSPSPALQDLRLRLQASQISLQLMRGEGAELLCEPEFSASASGSASFHIDAAIHIDRWWCVSRQGAYGQGACGLDSREKAWQPDPQVVEALFLPSWPLPSRWVALETACDAVRASGYDEVWSQQLAQRLEAERHHARAAWHQSSHQLRAALNVNRLEPEKWKMLYEF